MYSNHENTLEISNLPGVKVFNFDNHIKTDVRQTGLPANWRALDADTKASLLHSSYFKNHERNALERRILFIEAHNDGLKNRQYPRDEKPYFTTSREVITFSTRGEEDINFRRLRTETLLRLQWSTMEKDLSAWDQSVKWLAMTSHLDDATFRTEVAASISNLLLQESPLFQYLASAEIDVSDTHRALNKTPFLHTFDVLMAVETDDIQDDRERFFIRFHALFHDIGKAIIANNDHFQDHGAFSQSMLMEYAVRVWKMSSLEAYQVTQMERWHHASENINKNYIKNEEVISAMEAVHDIMVPALPLFSPEELYKALMKLNIADTESVKQHKFTLQAAEVSLEGMHLLAMKLKDCPHALQQWLLSLAKEGIRHIEGLDLTEKERTAELEKVHAIVKQSANVVRNMDPVIRDRLFKLFDPDFKDPQIPQQSRPGFGVRQRQIAAAA